jgi:hypothetical protein
MRTLINLAIAGLIVHGVWRAGEVFMVYYEFRDGVRQTAQFAGDRTTDELRIRVLEIAKDLQVPLVPTDVAVRRDREHVFIDASYRSDIELLPNYHHPWDFKVNIDAWTIVLGDARVP